MKKHIEWFCKLSINVQHSAYYNILYNVHVELEKKIMKEKGKKKLSVLFLN